jgi:hypothetical protein
MEAARCVMLDIFASAEGALLTLDGGVDRIYSSHTGQQLCMYFLLGVLLPVPINDQSPSVFHREF